MHVTCQMEGYAARLSLGPEDTVVGGTREA